MVYGVAERHEAKDRDRKRRWPGHHVASCLSSSAKSSHTTAIIKKPAPEQTKSLHIFCVDDEPLLRELLKELLELEGHIVETADGGEVRHQQIF